jgi:hypothetical protein
LTAAESDFFETVPPGVEDISHDCDDERATTIRR